MKEFILWLNTLVRLKKVINDNYGGSRLPIENTSSKMELPDNCDNSGRMFFVDHGQ